MKSCLNANEHNLSSCVSQLDRFPCVWFRKSTLYVTTSYKIAFRLYKEISLQNLDTGNCQQFSYVKKLFYCFLNFIDVTVERGGLNVLLFFP